MEGNEVLKLAKMHSNYVTFRVAAFWAWGAANRKEAQEYDRHVSAGNTVDTPVLFEPKIILYYHDVWHCNSRDTVREVISVVAQMPDVRKIQWDGGTWVKVDFQLPAGETHYIEGQETEEQRKRVTGGFL